MHNMNSYMVASVTQSLVWPYPFVSVLNCFKLPVLNNGPLESTFLYRFILFQAVSPKQRTVWVYLLPCFKPPVLNNEPLEFTFLSCFNWSVLNNGHRVFTCHFLRCHPQNIRSRGVTDQLQVVSFRQKDSLNPLKSVILSVSGQKVSLKILSSLSYCSKPIR